MSKLTLIRQSFSLRLNAVLAERGIAEKDHLDYVSRLMDIGTYTPERWLNAEVLPTTQLLALLAKRLGVNLEWLRSGRGEPRGEDSNLACRYHD